MSQSKLFLVWFRPEKTKCVGGFIHYTKALLPNFRLEYDPAPLGKYHKKMYCKLPFTMCV